MTGKVNRFEHLTCWQSARQLVKIVYNACLEGKLRRDFDLQSQLKRAALSSQNNIAEGFCRFYRKEFIRFLDISQSSAGEILSMCYNLEDLEMIDQDKIDSIRIIVTETRNKTLGLIRYLHRHASNKPNHPEHMNTVSSFVARGRHLNPVEICSCLAFHGAST
jgi:four helix bundle protein